MSDAPKTNWTKIILWSAIAGVLALLALLYMAGYTFGPAVLLSVLVAFLVGILLWIGLNPSSDGDASVVAQSSIPASSSAAASSASASTSTAAANTPAAVAANPAALKPSKELPGQAELAKRKGDWKYEREAKSPATKAAAAKKAAAKKPAAKTAAKSAATTKTDAKPAAKTAAKKPAASKAAAKPAAAKKPAAKAAKPAAKATKPAAKTAAKPAAKPAAKSAAKAAPKAAAKAAKPAAKPAAKAAKPAAKDGKPELLKKARAGGADDLKQIKGVGPKLETILHGMGVYHFDQVASWRKAEVKWVDEALTGVNKGRVSRDDWVAQAKTLAKGGETEFSKRVKKGGVY
jgi:predicted flap endonuclease-1-like 5' DNA nuclease